jgi:hypothetical protein
MDHGDFPSFLDKNALNQAKRHGFFTFHSPIYLFQTVPEDGHFLPNPPKGNSTRVNDGPTSNPNSKTREPSFSMLFPTSMNYYQLLIASGAAFSEIVLGFSMLGPNRSLRCKNNHRQSSCEGTCCFCLLAFLKAADRFSLWSSPNDPTFKGFTYLQDPPSLNPVHG